MSYSKTHDSTHNSMDEHINLVTTEVDMRADLLANSAKLLSEDKRVYYQDGDDDNYDLDDDINDYKKHSEKKEEVFNRKDEHSERNNTHTDNQESDTHNDSYKYSNKTKTFDPDDESSWTEEQLLLEKMKLLRQLGELTQPPHNIKLSKNYDITSDYKSMKFEYELHTGIRHKRATVDMMGNFMLGIVRGVELLNDNYNPLDMKFEGAWSGKVASNSAYYYDTLGEIYEKYTKSGKKMAPELRLFMMLIGSAVFIQGGKFMARFGSNTSQELDEDPEKLRQLRKLSEADRMEQERLINEKIMKEHELATMKAADLNKIRESKTEYEIMKKMASQNNTMNNFRNNMVLSESVRSRGNRSDTESMMLSNNPVMIPRPVAQVYQAPPINVQQNYVSKKQENAKLNELNLMQEKLFQMDKLLDSMDTDGKSSKSKKSSKLNTETSKSKSTKKYTNSSNSSNSSDVNMTESSTASTASSSSRISKNPKLDQILMKNAMKQIKEGGATVKVSDNDSIKLEHISIGKKSKSSGNNKTKSKPITVSTKKTK